MRRKAIEKTTQSELPAREDVRRESCRGEWTVETGNSTAK
jgi:hypothetical protein